jgi:hypothetical protein
MNGCIACGGPCTTECTDNHCGKYLGCDRGCRLMSLDEMNAILVKGGQEPIVKAR